MNKEPITIAPGFKPGATKHAGIFSTSRKNSKIFEYFQTFRPIFQRFSNVFERFQTFFTPTCVFGRCFSLPILPNLYKPTPGFGEIPPPYLTQPIQTHSTYLTKSTNVSYHKQLSYPLAAFRIHFRTEFYALLLLPLRPKAILAIAGCECLAANQYRS